MKKKTRSSPAPAAHLHSCIRMYVFVNELLASESSVLCAWNCKQITQQISYRPIVINLYLVRIDQCVAHSEDIRWISLLERFHGNGVHKKNFVTSFFFHFVFLFFYNILVIRIDSSIYKGTKPNYVSLVTNHVKA